MKVIRKIHPGWTEWHTMPKNMREKLQSGGPEGYFGKYHYVYEAENGKISLIKVNVGPYMLEKKNNWVWEIYAYDDKKLFEDIERYPTKKDAEQRIRSLLRGR